VIAESDQMRNVCEMIQKVALVDTPVPIYGESGTGKTLVARSIHAHSKRKEEPFLAIDCATLPVPLVELVLFGHVRGAPLTGDAPPKPGLFESAKAGTVLLEEIGSLPLNLQQRLLSVIKTKKLQRVGSTDVIDANPRILVTSNQSLEELRNVGLLDEDLYSLLSMIPIEIKGVRERPQDIIPLAYHILATETGKEEEELPTLSGEVREMLEAYSWPGNVGELVTAIKHAISCATDNKITKEYLPSKITAAYSAKPKVKSEETDDLKGKSLKAFISSKKNEYLDKLRPVKKTDSATYDSGAKRSRFGPKIRLTPEEDEAPKENGASGIKWQG
jgi:two-component system response regulator FlrC